MDTRQALSVIGALMVLAAFALSQAGMWRTRPPANQLTNLVGSGLLAAAALLEQQ